MALRVFVCVLQQPSRMSEHHLSSSSSSSSSASAPAAAAVKTVATDYRPSSPPAHLRSSLSSFSSATATDHATHSAVPACLSRRASRDIVSARFRSVGHVLNRHVRHTHHSSAVDGFGNYDRKPAGQQFRFSDPPRSARPYVSYRSAISLHSAIPLRCTRERKSYNTIRNDIIRKFSVRRSVRISLQ